MNRDIITGLDGEIYSRRDLSREWGEAIDLGKAKTGKSFAVDGYLGGTDRRDVWDSADRLSESASVPTLSNAGWGRCIAAI